MHFTSIILSISLAIGPVYCNEDYIVHEKRSNAPRSTWAKLQTPPDPAMLIPLTIALVSENTDAAEDHLLRVSDPDSPDYGNFWSPSEVARSFAPAPETYGRVMHWLSQSGVSPDRISRSHDATLLYVNTTVSGAEELLNTEYHFFSGPDDTHIACDEYSLPPSVAPCIEFVAPTVHIGVGSHVQPVKARRPRASRAPLADTARYGPARRDMASDPSGVVPASCAQFTTPDCLRAMYSIPQNEESHPDNSLGVYQQAWVSWLPGDLDGFFGYFAPELNGSRPVMAPVNGGYWQDDVQAFPFNAEADLDFEYTMTLTAPQAVTNYQVGDISAQGTMNSLLAAFDERYCGALDTSIDGTYPNPASGGYDGLDCGTLIPSHVISLSYAWNEANLPEAYLRRQCQQFLKLGLQGVSVIVSSADCGVAGQNCECVDPESGTPNGEIDRGNFSPTSPAGCPYVTSVGGTQWPANTTTLTHEVPFWRVTVGDDISSSGGGFSWVFDAPSYQKSATKKYLREQGGALRGISDRFYHGGRGVPDVAASASNYLAVINGQLTPVHGTSASTPVFASIVTLVNDARLKAGKRPVGFLNPVLYANPGVMNDIVDGKNHGCGVDAFKASRGWDPVTGLGTPDYERLVDLYLSLP